MLVLVLEVREARDSDSEASPRNVRNNTQQSIEQQEDAGNCSKSRQRASEMPAAIIESYVTIIFTIRAFVFLRTCNVTCKRVRPFTGRTAVINKT